MFFPHNNRTFWFGGVVPNRGQNISYFYTQVFTEASFVDNSIVSIKDENIFSKMSRITMYKNSL